MPLTRPGLSLCPLFTVTVIRPMEAQQKGVCSHCPVQDCQPLFGYKLSQGLCGEGGVAGGAKPRVVGVGVVGLTSPTLQARIRD